MKLTIFMHHPFALWTAPGWFSERLRQEFPQLNVVHLPDYQEVNTEIRDTDIAITWSIKPEQIRADRPRNGNVRIADLSVYLLVRSEEHTSELQSRGHIVCRLLL